MASKIISENIYSLVMGTSALNLLCSSHDNYI